MSSPSSLEDLNCTDPDGELDSSVGSVFLPLQRCSKRMKQDPGENADAVARSCGLGEGKSANKAAVISGELDFYFFCWVDFWVMMGFLCSS